MAAMQKAQANMQQQMKDMQTFMSDMAAQMQQHGTFPGIYRPGDGNKDRNKDDDDGHKRRVIVLEKKHFREILFLTETPPNSGHGNLICLFPLPNLTRNFGGDLKSMLAQNHDDKWDPTADPGISFKSYDKFAAELYGVIVSLTGGEAKSIVRGILENGTQDGYKALSVLNHRYNARTSSGLLRAFVEVVNPPEIKSGLGISKAITERESKLIMFKSHYGEEFNSNIKSAI